MRRAMCHKAGPSQADFWVICFTYWVSPSLIGSDTIVSYVSWPGACANQFSQRLGLALAKWACANQSVCKIGLSEKFPVAEGSDKKSAKTTSSGELNYPETISFF